MLFCCAIVQKLSSYERVQLPRFIWVRGRLLNGFPQGSVCGGGGGVCVYREEAEGKPYVYRTASSARAARLARQLLELVHYR